MSAVAARALYALGAVLLVVGVAVWVVPDLDGARSTRAGPITPPDAAAPIETAGGATAEATPARPLEAFALVADSNMFSPDRAAPRVRFTLASPEEEPPPAPPAVPRGPPAPRVYGITLRPADSTALIDADPKVSGAEIYRVGDTLVGGALIVEITDSTVVIEGPRGTRVLRLEGRTRPQTPNTVTPP